MRQRSVAYPIILVYEVIRLAALLRQGSSSPFQALPLSWYAGSVLLGLVPVLLFMLLLDETQFALWLPLVSLVKALGIPALLFFIASNLSEAVTIGYSGKFSLLGAVIAAALIIPGDIVTGIYCFRRYRTLCR